MAYTTINKSTDHFNTKLYTGNAGTQSITGVGFQPSLTWIKRRNTTGGHMITDAVRGATKTFITNEASAEQTFSNGLTSFDSDGFTVGNEGGFNSSHDIVSFNWKLGTTGSGSTGGSGTSKAYSYAVNVDAGISIIKYEGNGTVNHQIPHHLGVAPEMILFKNEQNGYAWDTYHVKLGNAHRLYLNLNYNKASSTFLNSTTPTNTYINLSNDSHSNHNGTITYAYCFTSKRGYSACSSFQGNGSNDGSYIHLGFAPSFLITKNVDINDWWGLFDNKRLGYNSSDSPRLLQPNVSDAEPTSKLLDFTSNGFKIRSSNSAVNGSGNKIIYLAFGQTIVGSNNIPNNAR